MFQNIGVSMWQTSRLAKGGYSCNMGNARTVRTIATVLVLVVTAAALLMNIDDIIVIRPGQESGSEAWQSVDVVQNAPVNVFQASTGSLGDDRGAAVAASSPAPLKVFVHHSFHYFGESFIKSLRQKSKRHAQEGSRWYFASEITFYDRLMKYEGLVTDPEAADAFYTPYFPSEHWLAERTHGHGVYKRWEQVLAKLRASEYGSYFDRRNGSDHIWMSAFDYGLCLVYQRFDSDTHVPDSVRKGLVLSTLGDTHWPNCYQPTHDITLPPPVPQALVNRIIFHAAAHILNSTLVDVQLAAQVGGSHKLSLANLYSKVTREAFFDWMEHIAPRRSVMLLWYGNDAAIRDLRRRLLSIIHNDKRFAKMKIHVPGREETRERLQPATLHDSMLKTRFCLCPHGWAPWSPRLTEVFLTGCIPVIIADDIVLPFEDLFDWNLFSVRVKEHEMSRLYDILTAITPEEENAMRQRLIALAPQFLMPSARRSGWWGEHDGFDNVMELLAKRVQERKQPGYAYTPQYGPAYYRFPNGRTLNYTAIRSEAHERDYMKAMKETENV